MTEKTIADALDVKLSENDAGASDVRGYLATLLLAVLVEEEGFSGKRPFGNSGWLYEIAEPLEQDGYDPSEPLFFERLVGSLCGVEFAA